MAPNIHKQKHTNDSKTNTLLEHTTMAKPTHLQRCWGKVTGKYVNEKDNTISVVN